MEEMQCKCHRETIVVKLLLLVDTFIKPCTVWSHHSCSKNDDLVYPSANQIPKLLGMRIVLQS